EYTTGAKVIGKVAGGFSKVQFFLIPGPVGTAITVPLVSAPLLEAAGRKDLFGYVKKHKLETAFAVGFVGFKAYKGFKYATQDVVKTIRTPTEFSVKQERQVPFYKRVGKDKIIKDRIIEYTKKTYWTPGKHSVQPRWQTWFGIKPKIITTQKQLTTEVLKPIFASDIKEAGGHKVFVQKGVNPKATKFKWVAGDKDTSHLQDFLAQKHIKTFKGKLIPRKLAMQQFKASKIVKGSSTTTSFQRPKIHIDTSNLNKVNVKIELETSKSSAEYFGTTRKIGSTPDSKIYEGKLVFKDLGKGKIWGYDEAGKTVVYKFSPTTTGRTSSMKEIITVHRPIELVTHTTQTAYDVPKYLPKKFEKYSSLNFDLSGREFEPGGFTDLTRSITRTKFKIPGPLLISESSPVPLGNWMSLIRPESSSSFIGPIL
ncbi:unnamed protein product, partial [marine sediment metagenome]